MGEADHHERSSTASTLLSPDGLWRNAALAGAAFLGLYLLLALPVLWTQRVLLLPASLVLAVTLAVLSAIDLNAQTLPDALTLPLAAFGLVVSAVSGVEPAWWPVASVALGFILLAGLAAAYRRLRGRQGLGLGDAKLMAAAGAWLGAQAIPTVLLLATLAALACVLAAHLRGRTITATTRLPFGPFLAFAIWITWLYGPL